MQCSQTSRANPLKWHSTHNKSKQVNSFNKIITELTFENFRKGSRTREPTSCTLKFSRVITIVILYKIWSGTFDFSQNFCKGCRTGEPTSCTLNFSRVSTIVILCKIFSSKYDFSKNLRKGWRTREKTSFTWNAQRATRKILKQVNSLLDSPYKMTEELTL